MILQRLVDYYNRIAADPAAAKQLALVGFSRENISFCLVLKPDGSADLQDIRQDGEKRGPLPVKLEVPHYGEKRTVNPRPYFLWDSTEYTLGGGRERTDPARNARRFGLFRELHLGLRSRVSIPEFDLLCQFLERWDPSGCTSLALWDEARGSNVVFRVSGQNRYLHEIDECRQAWTAVLAGRESTLGQSLVSGRPATVARLHPAIKGVIDPGGQAEKGIIAFNKDKTAFESYGKEQSYNAPVSVEEAAKYSNALNYLLNRPDRRFQLADCTVVYWADRPTPLEEFVDAVWGGFAPPKPDAPPEDQRRAAQVRLFLSQLRAGHAEGEAIETDDAVGFYVLGLSPNASRISVRFWEQSTVGRMKDRLRQHLDDVEVCGAREGDPPLSVRRIVQATGRAELAAGRFKGYDNDSVPPLLAGAVARAVLTGGPYPAMLLGAMLNRIRADGHVGHPRVAAIKACIVRNTRIQGTPKEVPVALDTNRTDPGYVSGRLFALLEKIQSDSARGELNATIKDRYFSAASVTPGLVFPRLIRLSQHHLAKMDTGQKVYYERQLGEVVGKLTEFPAHLPLEDQGLFAIGYFHQRQDLFTSKKDKEGGAE